MSLEIEVLEKKYVDLRKRLVEEIDRVEGRLEFYAQNPKDRQTEVMQAKYADRREKLFTELDKVDSRLQSYASMKKISAKLSGDVPVVPVKKQKMYRGRPVA